MSDYEFFSAILDFGDMIQSDAQFVKDERVRRILNNLWDEYRDIYNEAEARENFSESIDNSNQM